MPNETKWGEFAAPFQWGSYGIVDANGKSICEVFGRDPGPADDVMIAAPELYDLLERAVALFRTDSVLTKLPDHCSNMSFLIADVDAVQQWIESARAVLAKARGEQE